MAIDYTQDLDTTVTIRDVIKERMDKTASDLRSVISKVETEAQAVAAIETVSDAANDLRRDLRRWEGDVVGDPAN